MKINDNCKKGNITRYNPGMNCKEWHQMLCDKKDKLQEFVDHLSDTYETFEKWYLANNELRFLINCCGDNLSFQNDYVQLYNLPRIASSWGTFTIIGDKYPWELGLEEQLPWLPDYRTSGFLKATHDNSKRGMHFEWVDISVLENSVTAYETDKGIELWRRTEEGEDVEITSLAKFYNKDETDKILLDLQLKIFESVDHDLSVERKARIDADSTLVTLSTLQTIGGSKIFSSPSGIRVSNNSNITSYKQNSIVVGPYTLIFPNSSGTIALESEEEPFGPNNILEGSNISLRKEGNNVTISATNTGSFLTTVNTDIMPPPEDPSTYDFDTVIKEDLQTKGLTPINNDYVYVTYPLNDINPTEDRCAYNGTLNKWVWEYRFVGDISHLEHEIDLLEQNKQNKQDNSLLTEDKTVVGAINELYQKVPTAKAFSFIGMVIQGDDHIATIDQVRDIYGQETCWESIGGRMLIGANSEYPVLSTGGSATKSLNAQNIPSHSHTAGTLSAASAGNHRHNISEIAGAGTMGTSAGGGGNDKYTDYAGSHTHTISGSTAAYGSGTAFNILNPYFAVYMWRRIADRHYVTVTFNSSLEGVRFEGNTTFTDWQGYIFENIVKPVALRNIEGQLWEFNNWYLDGSDPFTPVNPYMEFNENTTIHPNFVQKTTVICSSDDPDVVIPDPSTFKVNTGVEFSSITMPAAVKTDLGEEFPVHHWYIDGEDPTVPVDPDYVIPSLSITFHPYFITRVTIECNSDDPTVTIEEPSTFEAPYNHLFKDIEKPTATKTVEGEIWTFIHWYLDGTDPEIAIDDNLPITSDITIHPYFKDTVELSCTSDEEGVIIEEPSTLDVPFGTHFKDIILPNATKTIEGGRDYDLVHWYLDGTEATQPIDPEYVIDEDTIIHPYFVEIDFSLDSWSKVIDASNEGLEALHTRYRYDCEHNADFPGTLIGMTRTVNINGREQTARVIDEEHDDLADGNGKATLTFDFTRPLYDSTGRVYTRSISPEQWSTSAIRTYLQEDLFDSITDEDLKNGIKSVIKSTHYGPEASKMEDNTYESTTEKLFIITAIEYGSTSGNGYYEGEGTRYAYYTSLSETPITQSTNNILRTSDEEKGSTYYLYYYTYSGWTGRTFEYSTTERNLSIMPLFCI